MTAHHRLRMAVSTLVLGTGLLTGGFGARPAEAYSAACRSDPVVTLSNLATIDLSANISDSQTDVRSVTYIIHAPAGTHVIAVANTDGLMGLLEHIQFFADNTANQYDFYTTVSTGQTGIAVSAEAIDISALGLVIGSSSTPGISNHPIHTSFQSLL